MNNEKVYILEDRSILYVSGDDCYEFLQNLVSNDLSKVKDDNSCFASLLTPQGKFLFEFIIIKHKSGYFIDCEKSQSEELFKQLNLYKLRSKVDLMNLSNEFVVAAFSLKKFLEFDYAKQVLGHTIKYREDPILLDPRNQGLGARLIINLEKLYLSLKKLKLKSSDTSEYYTLSHKLGIVPLGLNKLQNKIFGVECNYEELNCIDYKKGCFVGQENTARIKHKNKLSKRLFSLKLINGSVKENDIINFEGKEIGKILIDGNYPFGLIKFKELNLDTANLITESGSLKINKPNWINF
ncbi:CAF17-like 4Fe-4S cluster assembly/insertion protein YgfZ [Candidatus Pelagibacter sp.]|uniref:CAF17-like 4Fe-4S cluster assembly/insertion protein YgfZ n=1 Tax=Candidatus Pelagibacter sp. TaxID=2024849 RepID=UPI003F830FAF